MWYHVSLETGKGRMRNHIKAGNKTVAKKKVDVYNKKHPDWNMKLLKYKPYK